MTPPPIRENLGYVPQLDGVRATAIISVMMFHAHFQLGTGGSIGVDSFFALSGFLITTLLLQEERRIGRVDVVRFYQRRSLRLLPPLAVLLAVVTLFALVARDGSKRNEILGEVVATSLYAGNLGHHFGVHFDLLAHTWSLAVEEQFYLLWPLFIIFVVRWRRTRLLVGCLIAASVTLLTMRIAGSQSDVVASRPDSLFVGCLAAFAWRGGQFKRVPNWVTSTAFAGLVIVALRQPLGRYFPKIGYTLGAVLTAVVILGIMNGSDQQLVGKALATRPLIAIGRISYALYLWHVPIFRWTAMHTQIPGSVRFVLKWIITFMCAWLSWILIEKPSARVRRRLTSRPALSGARGAHASSPSPAG